MSKLVAISLLPREEIIGKDERFKIETSDFKGAYTNTLAKAVGKLIVVEEIDTGDFILNALESDPIRIHKSWVSTVDPIIQTADELVAEGNPTEE